MRVWVRIFFSTILVMAGARLLAGQAGKPAEGAPSNAAAPAATRASLAGMYNGGQMEVAAQLLLKADGHFNYGLAYGAMDEEGEGTWEVKEGAVFLTSVPAVKQPAFVVVSDTPDARGGLWIKVSNGPLMEGARQRIYLVYGPGEPAEMSEVGDDGSVPFPDKRRPTAIIPEIPVYPVTTKAILLTGTGGHSIVLRFEKNDIGKADFRGMRLEIQDGVLVMPRRDLELVLRFRRQK
jgi:hypothetical protein